MHFRSSHGSQLDAMILWMWDGLDYQILMFMRESFWAAHSIRVAWEFGLWISWYFSMFLCFTFAGSFLNHHPDYVRFACQATDMLLGTLLSFKQQIEPYTIGNASTLNGRSESKSSSGGNMSVVNDNTAKATLGRFSDSQSSDPLAKETKSLGRLSVSQNSDAVKEPKILTCM